MKKNRREFFEVFRRVPEEKEPTTWWRKNTESGSAAGLKAASPAAAVPLTPVPPRAAAATSNKVVLTLSRELLVVIAVAMTLALVGAFVWGRSARPNSTAVAVNPSPPADAAKAPALAIREPAPLAPPYYTLRLNMTNLNHQNAERIAADLCAKGYDAFPLPSSASAAWSVNIGRFPSYLSKDAEALKKKVNAETYKNQRLMCSWEPVRK